MSEGEGPTVNAEPGRQLVGPAATAAVLAATLGLAAACWAVAVWQMSGMGMGVATRLGSFASGPWWAS